MVVANRTRVRIEQALKDELDVDLSTYDALLHTFEAGPSGLRMTDLAEHMLFTRAGVTSMVDRLVERGIAARVPDEDDRRVTLVRLTPNGEQLFRQAAAVHNAVVRESVTDHLDEDQASRIVEALEGVPSFDVLG